VSKYNEGDVVTRYAKPICMTLFHCTKGLGRKEPQYTQVQCDTLAEAQHRAIAHVSASPIREGCGLFEFAFDRHTGRSLRITSGASLDDLFGPVPKRFTREGDAA